MVREITKSELPSYENPPIIEVVCGLRFKGLEGFKVPHYGAFWASIDDDFPHCENAQPLGFGPDVDEASTGLPVPRVWLINESEGRLIQMQRNNFLYNWRKGQGDKSYPRYETIIKEFDLYLSKYIDFVSSNDLGKVDPVECELTYINMIPQDHGWKNAGDYGKIFPDIGWKRKKSRFLPIPTQMNWRTVVALPDDAGHMEIKLDRGVRKTDKEPVLMFELTARGIFPGMKLGDIRKWYDVAHEWIVMGFSDLTSSKIQGEIWKKR